MPYIEFRNVDGNLLGKPQYAPWFPPPGHIIELNRMVWRVTETPPQWRVSGEEQVGEEMVPRFVVCATLVNVTGEIPRISDFLPVKGVSVPVPAAPVPAAPVTPPDPPAPAAPIPPPASPPAPAASPSEPTPAAIPSRKKPGPAPGTKPKRRPVVEAAQEEELDATML